MAGGQAEALSERDDLIILYGCAAGFSWVDDAHLYLSDDYALPLGDCVVLCGHMDRGRTVDYAAAWVGF